MHAEDNQYPYVTVTKEAAGSVATPVSGDVSLFVDTADGLLKMKDSSGNLIVQPGTILATSEDTAGDHTITATSAADLDATHDVVTFTVPASGKVLVRLTATCGADHNNVGSYISWGLRDGTTNIGRAGTSTNPFASIANRQGGSSLDEYTSCSRVFPLVGLTPGASKTYKWACWISAGTGNMKATTDTPAVMEVIAN